MFLHQPAHLLCGLDFLASSTPCTSFTFTGGSGAKRLWFFRKILAVPRLRIPGALCLLLLERVSVSILCYVQMLVLYVTKHGLSLPICRDACCFESVHIIRQLFLDPTQPHCLKLTSLSGSERCSCWYLLCFYIPAVTDTWRWSNAIPLF